MLNTLITIVVTVLMLCVLVVIHEGGHYLVARACGVGIMEFAIGMGPVIYRKKGKYNDFTIRLLPIGGFVSMIGEEDVEIPEEHLGKPSLNEKKTWQKMLIVLAGPFMNVLLGVLLMAGLVISSDGITTTTVGKLCDQEDVEQFSGLSLNQSGEYGLQVGDEIIKINGKRVFVFYDVNYYIQSKGIEPLDLTVIRDGKRVVLEDVQFPINEKGGVKYGGLDFRPLGAEKTFSAVCYEAFWQPISTIRTTVQSLVDTVTGRYGINGVSGVVGMGQAMNEVISTGESIANIISDLLAFMVLISLSLGIFNLIPLPALDGGRFIIYAIEGITGKQLNQKWVTAAITVSMVALLILMLVITFKDIIFLF